MAGGNKTFGSVMDGGMMALTMATAVAAAVMNTARRGDEAAFNRFLAGNDTVAAVFLRGEAGRFQVLRIFEQTGS